MSLILQVLTKYLVHSRCPKISAEAMNLDNAVKVPCTMTGTVRGQREAVLILACEQLQELMGFCRDYSVMFASSLISNEHGILFTAI